MKIVISGASGFIGQHLVKSLQAQNCEVIPLVRSNSLQGIFWDPARQIIEADQLNGCKAVIHLAGENVAERWTEEKKTKILASRIDGTTLLANALANLSRPPSVFISASAIGYYGERGEQILTEDSGAGDNFLSHVCVQWEAATSKAKEAGIRTVIPRFGIVLSTTGGAFPRMLAPFRLGAGGRLGTGKQYMSWVSLDDTIAALHFLIAQSDLADAINIVSPQAVSNNDFTEILGHVLHKPALFPVPISMAHMAFGHEMADEVLLCSARVIPEKLSAAGFKFQQASLTKTLTDLLSSQVG